MASAIELFDRGKKPLERKASARKVLQVGRADAKGLAELDVLSAGLSSLEVGGTPLRRADRCGDGSEATSVTSPSA
nr:hypothetical protein [Deltaproteobacteria bacterium]